jgi:hypothetical protein
LICDPFCDARISLVIRRMNEITPLAQRSRDRPLVVSLARMHASICIDSHRSGALDHTESLHRY